MFSNISFRRLWLDPSSGQVSRMLHWLSGVGVISIFPLGSFLITVHVLHVWLVLMLGVLRLVYICVVAFL